jgi:hypothetical protein
MPKYNVSVKHTLEQTAEFEIEAEDEEDAEQQALTTINNADSREQLDLDWQFLNEEFDIDDVDEVNDK